MKIDAYLDEETFRTFTKFDILSRRRLWKSPVIFCAIMCTAAAICFLMHSVDGAVLLGAVLAAIGLGMPVVYFTTFFSSLKKQVKAQKLAPPRLVYSFDLTEKSDGIGISNGKESVSYRWQDAYHAYRNNGCLYLFMTADRAFLIPAFKQEETTDRLWSMLKKMLGKDKCTDLRKKK